MTRSEFTVVNVTESEAPSGIVSFAGPFTVERSKAILLPTAVDESANMLTVAVENSAIPSPLIVPPSQSKPVAPP